jgi:hypothetical protein
MDNASQPVPDAEDPVNPFPEPESISNRGLRSLLFDSRLFVSLHSGMLANEGLSGLVIQRLRPHLG